MRNRKKRLTKSNTDVVLSGTLGGIAEYLEIDSTVLRIIYVLLLLFGLGSPVLLYIILVLLIPRRYSSNSYKNYHYYSKTDPKEKGRKDVTNSAFDNESWDDF
ncbi:MAG: PspC domain-containing protein [Streptococcaceae bacterium]|jgi:phage shock protein PspC (stress-responsive transcriptional regulator)|nr:PspC domain-containing protein [Streptococcaceae bacterium]